MKKEFYIKGKVKLFESFIPVKKQMVFQKGF